MAKHEFGGKWTEEKLECLRKYLCAYTTIFKGNPKAAFFSTIFFDAFAGTGHRADANAKTDAVPTGIWNEEDGEAEAYRKGSARIALEVDPSFDYFVLVEQREERVQDLVELRSLYPEKLRSIDIRQGDANDILVQWCAKTNWKNHRAVVFLDPYGMQVEWTTIAAIAGTGAIDLWILFPLGMAINRLLTKNEPPPPGWSNALTRFFGTDEWRQAFYKKKTERTLFGDEESETKDADFDKIGSYFLSRLKTVFAKVAANPLVLRNSTGSPIYLLCFAAGNEKGAHTAVKIAQDILK